MTHGGELKCLGCVLASALAALVVLASGGCIESTKLPEAAVTTSEAPAAETTAPVATDQTPAPPAEVAASTDAASPADAQTGAGTPEAPAATGSVDAPTGSTTQGGAEIVEVAARPGNPADRFSRPPPPSEPPPGPKVLRPGRPGGANGLNEISFDTIKFDIEKDGLFERGMIPESIEKLVGQRIRIYGYILPTSVFQESGIKQFVLVRDNQECCFGPGAALYDCIVVKMAPGRTTDFSVRPVAVEGRFSISELKVRGKTLAIYHLDGESAK